MAMPSPLSFRVVESGAPGLNCSPSALSRSALTPEEAAAAFNMAAAAAAWPGSTTPAPVVARERPSAPKWIPGAVIPSGPTWRLAAGPENGPEPSVPGVRVVMEEAVGMSASVKIKEKLRRSAREKVEKEIASERRFLWSLSLAPFRFIWTIFVQLGEESTL